MASVKIARGIAKISVDYIYNHRLLVICIPFPPFFIRENRHIMQFDSIEIDSTYNGVSYEIAGMKNGQEHIFYIYGDCVYRVQKVER